MFDLDRWKEIWETIARNRKRSIMTGLGVFWGIFMFTVLMGFGMWLGRTATASLGGYSTNTSYFFTDQTSIPYKGMPSGRWWDFDTRDLEAIRRQVPEIKYAAAMNWGGRQNVSHNDRKGEYYLMGYTHDFQQINPQPLKFGRFINRPDMDGKRKVCVIGEQIWKELFPGGENPVGENIKMNDLYLTVVGVMERGSTSINIGSNPETTIAVPNPLVQQLWNEGTSVDMIVVTAEDGASIEKVEEQCKRIIAANHIISPDDKKAISGFNLGEEFEKLNGLLGGIGLLTWIVGLGTLLAGIVGVSNIMLVIVRERTQEIGVRRAIGARPWSIISQILSESFLLTFIAGILGLAAGVGLLSLFEKLIATSMDGGMQPLQITFGLGITATLIIIAGSLLAGIIPASRAMKIKAVDAIREE
ncbi:MAG TPA: ABC transporter permease [Candidatus Tidjanibacter gallistercoris]|nr:ABC transporter permease [Candidatus Tidjanibacter gallistercoris]